MPDTDDYTLARYLIEHPFVSAAEARAELGLPRDAARSDPAQPPAVPAHRIPPVGCACAS